MNKINLMGNLITDPFTIEPKTIKVKHRDAWPPSHKTKQEVYAQWKHEGAQEVSNTIQSVIDTLKSQHGKEIEKKKIEIKTIVMCGCGNHPINPKKDPYMQHNNWIAQFHPYDESGRSDIRKVKGLGTTTDKYTPTYDFSGDEFEVTSTEMRELNDKKQNSGS